MPSRLWGEVEVQLYPYWTSVLKGKWAVNIRPLSRIPLQKTPYPLTNWSTPIINLHWLCMYMYLLQNVKWVELQICLLMWENTTSKKTWFLVRCFDIFGPQDDIRLTECLDPLTGDSTVIMKTSGFKKLMYWSVWHCVNHRLGMPVGDAVLAVPESNWFRSFADKLYILYQIQDWWAMHSKNCPN